MFGSYASLKGIFEEALAIYFTICIINHYFVF